MFLDASSVVAILAREDDADILLAKMEGAKAGRFFYSPISAYEAVASLAQRHATITDGENAPVQVAALERAEREVFAFFEAVGAREMAIAGNVTRIAKQAARQFGKAVAHPARLNMGDCFAYACAVAYGVPLLCKGSDFPQTDIECA